MPVEMFCRHCVYWAETHCHAGKIPTSCGAYFTPRRPAPFEPEYPYQPDVTPIPAEAMAETPPETPADASTEAPQTETKPGD